MRTAVAAVSISTPISISISTVHGQAVEDAKKRWPGGGPWDRTGRLRSARARICNRLNGGHGSGLGGGGTVWVVVRFGVVRFGVVRFGVVWFGAVWCGLVR
ncbi:hypothetical protein BZA05DRAFT_99348 [Tricharina praecox]|uniref:uncharacterized protein n=1 Tax=Tricharina praecox TaxID=43433 RepID=UPI002220EDE3|nr:uncharacterized protein BZA05DRAFT_99348 [Tricharina praecox]KAI5857554.1 hypothetical protein BZA05DRAFT_99348 [Tricharina praecox]